MAASTVPTIEITEWLNQQKISRLQILARANTARSANADSVAMP